RHRSVGPADHREAAPRAHSHGDALRDHEPDLDRSRRQRLDPAEAGATAAQLAEAATARRAGPVRCAPGGLAVTWLTRGAVIAVAVFVAARPAGGPTFPPVRAGVVQVEGCALAVLVGCRPASGEATDTLLARIASQPKSRM